MAILIVDDSTTMRRIVKRTVEGMNQQLYEAAEGVTALKILEEKFSDIQLMIMDLNMPGISGLEVLRTVKSDPRFRDIVVMMLTSEADPALVLEALKLGAQNYLTKPFDYVLLKLKIEESLLLAAKS